MSELPGFDLEDYVLWNHSLVVNGKHGNTSVAMAVALGTTEDHRLYLDKHQFKKILAIYEPHREYVERMLEDFDEEEHSWRGYASGIVLPDHVFNMAEDYIKLYREMAKLDVEIQNFDAIVESVTLIQGRTPKAHVEFKDKIQPDLELTATGIDELITKLSAVRLQMK